MELIFRFFARLCSHERCANSTSRALQRPLITGSYLAGLLGLFALLAGCSSTPTEIVVLVDTNLEVPAELDRVVLTVTSPTGETVMADASLAMTQLPISQSHVRGGGAVGPYRFEATGFLSTSSVVSLARDANFVDGERRTLRLNLDQSCASMVCAEEGTTCVQGACVAVALAPLEAYEGKTRFYGAGEAGVPDTGLPDTSLPEGGLPDRSIPDAMPETCVPQDEACDGADNDCDGKVDEGFDLTMDPDNCGQCGVTCRPNAGLGISTASCAASTCTFTCATNYGDCDGDVSDGCEDLTTKQRCGSCGNSCRGNRTCMLNVDTYECI